MTKFNTGDVIGNRYKVLKILGGLGKTGRGIIYVCLDLSKTKGKHIFALKTLQERYLESELMINAFKREALAWVQLEKHPYIVKAISVENIENNPFIILEYIAPGKNGKNNLSEYLNPPISLTRALKWSIQFCFGMEYAYTKGITPHRDIKPDNLMISANKVLKITDFGLAMFLGEKTPASKWKESAEKGELGFTFLRYSRGDIFGGTVPWMAPEQFDTESDLRSDIYSYGIILYQMRNKGELPFKYESVDDYENAHKNEALKALNSRAFPIINKCLEKKPENRYQSFRELRYDLESLYKKLKGRKTIKPPKKEKLTALDHFNKAISFKFLGFIEDAITELNYSLKLNPKLYRANIELGLIYEKEGNLNESIKEFRRALKIKSSSDKVREFLNNLKRK